MTFDLATAAFFSSLVEVALSIGMFALWGRDKNHYLLFWSLGFFSFGAGSLLITLRGQIPDIFSILLANICTSSSSVLFYIGISFYFKRRCAWLSFMLLLLSVEVILLAYFTYIQYDTSIRIYVYNSIQAATVLMILTTILDIRKNQIKIVNPELIAITSLFFVIHCARLIGTPFFPAPMNFLESGNFQTLLAFGLMVIHISYSQVFANMHAAALNTKINKALIHAQNKEKQKVEVLGYIGHDLRAPLATISSYSSMLLSKADEDQRRPLQAIQRSIQYQLGLIDELLEYAKSELQPLAVQASQTDLHLLIDDISDYAIALCIQKNNRFRCETPDPLPLRVMVDAKRLQQVLLNLLSNAAKFTRDGQVELHITANAKMPLCELDFSVRDTGIGINLHEDLDIFGAFQQVQEQSGSTGLGLFIAQHVVLAMGGTLSASSRLNHGSVFSFKLSVPMVGAEMSTLPGKSTAATVNESSWVRALPSHLIQESSLQQLQLFAQQGRLSDIVSWIHEYDEEPELAAFLAQLRQLLEQFDFASIDVIARMHANKNC